MGTTLSRTHSLLLQRRQRSYKPARNNALFLPTVTNTHQHLKQPRETRGYKKKILHRIPITNIVTTICSLAPFREALEPRGIGETETRSAQRVSLWLQKQRGGFPSYVSCVGRGCADADEESDRREGKRRERRKKLFTRWFEGS